MREGCPLHASPGFSGNTGSSSPEASARSVPVTGSAGHGPAVPGRLAHKGALHPEG